MSYEAGEERLAVDSITHQVLSNRRFQLCRNPPDVQSPMIIGIFDQSDRHSFQTWEDYRSINACPVKTCRISGRAARVIWMHRNTPSHCPEVASSTS